MIPGWADVRPDGVLVRVKAVPGSSRNRVQGVLGDHLKVQISAAPEAGKANAAIVDLLAALFRSPRSSVRQETGASNPRKSFTILGATDSVFTREEFSALRPGG